jgi:hypothetical protein
MTFEIPKKKNTCESNLSVITTKHLKTCRTTNSVNAQPMQQIHLNLISARINNHFMF